MTATDVIALCAAAVALLAMCVAIWQGVSAHRSATAAKDQAESARQAAAATEEQASLLRRQVEAEAEDRRDRLAEPARSVAVDLHGPSVRITNHGTAELRDVELVGIASAAGDPVPWQLSSAIFGNRPGRQTLAPNDSLTVALDQVGENAAAATVRFTDSTGRRWLRTGTGEPRPAG